MKKIIISLILILVVGLLVSFNSSHSVLTTNKLYEEIIKNNTILDNNSKENGLYKIDNKYYFKGNVINNYVSIGNSLWRILSIDSE